MKLLFLLTLVTGYGVLAYAQETPRTLSVCDLLREPSKHNGKVIALRGVYLVTGHGAYLRGENCNGILTTQGYRWPSMIWVSAAGEEYRRRGMEFAAGLDAVGDLSLAMAAQNSKFTDDEKVTLTFVGLIETHQDFDKAMWHAPYGLVGVGFGQVPGAPGQLFVVSVKDVVVTFKDLSAPKQNRRQLQHSGSRDAESSLHLTSTARAAIN